MNLYKIISLISIDMYETWSIKSSENELKDEKAKQ